jgi:hypothetical protein
MLLGYQIVNLSADKPGSASRLGQYRTTESRPFRRANSLRQGLKGQREQRIPGQNGQGISEDFMASRPTAAQIVVIHRREVVMDQGIGMDHFHGAGGGHGPLGFAAAGFGGQQDQHRSKAFARA